MTKQRKRGVPGSGSRAWRSLGPVLSAGLACVLAMGMRPAIGSEAAPGSQRTAPAQQDTKAGAELAEDYRLTRFAVFHPRLPLLLTGIVGGRTVQLWDLATRSRVMDLQAESNCGAFSRDGRLVAVGCDFGACVIDLETHRVVSKARLRFGKGHNSPPQFCAIAFAEDPRFVAVAEFNGEVSIWDRQTNSLTNESSITLQFTRPGGGDWTFFVRRIPKKSQWIVGRDEGDILLLDMNAGTPSRISRVNEPYSSSSPRPRSYDPVSNRVLLVSDESLVTFSVAQKTYGEPLPLPYEPLAIQADENGKYLVVTAWDRSEAIVFRPSRNGFVKLFSLSEIAASAQRGQGAFLCAAFDSKSEYLFLGGADDPVRYPQHPSLLIDLRTRKCLGPLQTYCSDRSKEVKIRIPPSLEWEKGP